MPTGNGEPTKLSDEDWEMLLPVSSFELGKTTLLISPLGLEELSKVLHKIKTVAEEWRDVIVAQEDPKPSQERHSKGKKNKQKITDAASKEDAIIDSVIKYIPRVALIISTHAPDLIYDLSGLDIADIKRLPLKAATELFIFCLNLNIESQRGLEKNLKDLVEGITILTDGATQAVA